MLYYPPLNISLVFCSVIHIVLGSCLCCSNEKKRYDLGLKLAHLCLSECQFRKAVSLCDELMSSDLWNESEGLPVYRVLALALSRSGDVSDEENVKVTIIIFLLSVLSCKSLIGQIVR
jgi:hypothetical protein